VFLSPVRPEQRLAEPMSMEKHEVNAGDLDPYFDSREGKQVDVYLASEVDALLHRIEVEARQQSPFTMANIVRLIIQARNNSVLMDTVTK
jgi:hypothetical protein